MTTFAAVAARIEHAPREAAPFVKWVGGKGRLLSQLRPLLPSGVEQMRHVEPFVGGGALFFARRPRRALLTDINPTLVSTYAAIRDDVDGVIAGLRKLAGRHSKQWYYEVRERYNQNHRLSKSKRAAMFIYLNKTCFNGLHRVNRKGEFNVPVGSYKNPRILNEDALRAASEALRGADLRCASFDMLLENAKPGDFIYFDPPYEPVSATASFTSYASGGFSQDDQTRLRDVYEALDRRRCKLMLSNSDVPFIRRLYDGFKVDTVAAPRAINCDATKRGRVSEVVVRNYA
ncbi:MAG: DNA adenine methylase [Myxococcales bacterium]|nr:DNA adenine methylase [Myxococcales bacterium]